MAIRREPVYYSWYGCRQYTLLKDRVSQKDPSKTAQKSNKISTWVDLTALENSSAFETLLIFARK